MPGSEQKPAASPTGPPRQERHGESSHGSGGHGGGGHGPPQGHQEEHHEGAPEWIISFADNVTLLMGFFVLMLAMTMASAIASAGRGTGAEGEGQGSQQAEFHPTPEMLDLMISVRKAFHNPVDAENPGPGEEAMAERLRQLAGAMDAGLPGGKAAVQSLRDTDYHALSGYVLFEQRSAELSAQARVDLAQFARMTRGLRLMIEVRAHTSAAEAFEQEDRGIRFSLDRALAVARYLTEQGLEWGQLRLIPQGDTDPIQSRAYEQSAHAQNACVEFRVSNDLVRR